jgi:hypothetical protein
MRIPSSDYRAELFHTPVPSCAMQRRKYRSRRRHRESRRVPWPRLRGHVIRKLGFRFWRFGSRLLKPIVRIAELIARSTNLRSAKRGHGTRFQLSRPNSEL